MAGKSDERLFAAVAYVVPVLGSVLAYVLGKDKWTKFHAVQSLLAGVAWVIFSIVWGVITSILAFVTFGLGALCGLVSLVPWVAFLYWAWKAFKGEDFELPVIGKPARDFVEKG